jgi:hypothetical protein
MPRRAKVAKGAYRALSADASWQMPPKRSEAMRMTPWSLLRCLSFSKHGTPCSLQHTASPSIRQLRTFSLFTAWTTSV